MHFSTRSSLKVKQLAMPVKLHYLQDDLIMLCLISFGINMFFRVVRDQSVISSGLIQMIVVGGEFLRVELDTLLDKISPRHSTTAMDSLLSRVHTNSSWRF